MTVSALLLDGRQTVSRLSLDVECHYPNIDIDLVAEEAKLEVMESHLEIEIDTEEVALFLACSMSQADIDSEGLSHVVHKRRHKNGSRPGLTCEAITGGPVVRAENDSWIPPARRPTRGQRNRMVGCLLKSAIKLVMKNCSRVKRLKGNATLQKSKAKSLVEKDKANPSKADNPDFTKPNFFHVHCTAADRPTPETLNSKPGTSKLDGHTH